jgi:hypothetical protein
LGDGGQQRLALARAGVQPLDQLTPRLVHLAGRPGIEWPSFERLRLGNFADRCQLGPLPEMRRQGRIADLGRGIVGDLAIAARDIDLKIPRLVSARGGAQQRAGRCRNQCQTRDR